uniref:GIY-YIG domain-containing protein n=1 Tax=viral metagenome TaxID=1070528 RepID=A0A6C0D7H1_9ZZZZ
MTENINKYNEGKIYKLLSNNLYYYIGSTINSLNKRLSYHKQSSKKFPNRKIYKYINSIGWDNIKIELIENFSCSHKKELNERENYYIKQHIKDEKCLNIKKAVLNKEEIIQQHKQYREENKDKLKEYFTHYNIVNSIKRNEYNKEYVKENEEKVKNARKKYYENNKELITQKNNTYKETNKELVAKRKKIWAEKNTEHIKSHSKEYREENKEYIKEKTKKYYEENKEKILEKFKKYNETNKDKLKEKQAEYRAKNKEQIQCNCGGSYIKLGKSKHEKTNKHTKYIIEQQVLTHK